MPKTEARPAKATSNVEAWLDNVDPDTMVAEDITDLQRIAAARDKLNVAAAELQEAVNAARTNGRTWARIGILFGISRQSAQERFGRRTTRRSKTAEVIAAPVRRQRQPRRQQQQERAPQRQAARARD